MRSPYHIVEDSVIYFSREEYNAIYVQAFF